MPNALAQILQPLKNKVDEGAFTITGSSNLDVNNSVMNSGIRKDGNKEIRKKIADFKKSPDYATAETFVKEEIENLDTIFPPRSKKLFARDKDIDDEDSVVSALRVLMDSKLVDGNLKTTIQDSLTGLEKRKREYAERIRRELEERNMMRQ